VGWGGSRSSVGTSHSGPGVTWPAVAVVRERRRPTRLERGRDAVEGGVLIGHCGVGADPLAAGEVARQVPGGDRLSLDREPLPVGGGQGAGAERRRQRQPVVIAHDRGVGRFQGVGAEIPFRGSGQRVIRHPG